MSWKIYFALKQSFPWNFTLVLTIETHWNLGHGKNFEFENKMFFSLLKYGEMSWKNYFALKQPFAWNCKHQIYLVLAIETQHLVWDLGHGKKLDNFWPLCIMKIKIFFITVDSKI